MKRRKYDPSANLGEYLQKKKPKKQAPKPKEKKPYTPFEGGVRG